MQITQIILLLVKQKIHIGYAIPKNSEYVYAVEYYKNYEQYSSIPYHAIPVKKVEEKDFLILEQIDPDFRKNNSELYERNC